MKRLGGLAMIAGAIILAFCQVAGADPIAGIYTYHYDNARDGLNSNETILTPSNVNQTTFGKLFSRAVDGYVYAEPLYVNSVQFQKFSPREAVYVATEHDSVYAFDASGAISAPLWKVSFINPKKRTTTIPWERVGTTDLVPEVGITGTPVIDPASGTLYVAVATMEKGAYFYRLHALDIATGAEKFGGPIVINATLPGTGVGSDANGNISFVPLIANQRSGLTLNNGVVYVAFASHGDNGGYHGWMLGYDASTLAQVSAFAVTPDGVRGGIWMAGGAPVINDEGGLFVATGNGTFDANLDGGIDYGDSLLKLGPTDSSNFGVIDYFTPYDQGKIDDMDLDYGSSGVLALPDQSVGPAHLLFTGSKEGTLYLLDADNLGGFNPIDDSQIVQSIMGETTGQWSTPAYFNGLIYVDGEADNLKAFSLANGQLSTSPVSISKMNFNYPGTTPVVSANGIQNGIVWALGSSGTAVLHAFDASDLTNELYNSAQKKARDGISGFVKFSVPTVANGRVFVGSQKRLTVFGLLPPKK
jgi:hypothetical protein